MPRPPRLSAGNVCYHVLNRTNDRAPVFDDPAPCRAFLRLLGRSRERTPVRILAWCLMPNHFHLVLWPCADGDLGRFMHWLLTSFACRSRRVRPQAGYLWQGRYKAVPVQDDAHLLTVLRYVERNPVRAGLVQEAEGWPWSSSPARGARRAPLALDAPPLPLRPDWSDWVNRPQTAAELKALRASFLHGTPYGDRTWVEGAAARLGLPAAPRLPGRPACRRIPRSEV